MRALPIRRVSRLSRRTRTDGPRSRHQTPQTTRGTPTALRGKPHYLAFDILQPTHESLTFSKYISAGQLGTRAPSPEVSQSPLTHKQGARARGHTEERENRSAQPLRLPRVPAGWRRACPNSRSPQSSLRPGLPRCLPARSGTHCPPAVRWALSHSPG